jgi:DNA-binding NarL/FixJ family response regulator
MPMLNGLDAGRRLKADHPGVRLIYLTMNPDPELAGEALRLGAAGYVLKSSAASELTQAIGEALRGRLYLTPLLTQNVVDALVRRRPGPELTDRQREVLQLIAEGHSMKEIGHILQVAPRTVAFHKYRMMRQLRLRTNAELIQFAVKLGMVA